MFCCGAFLASNTCCDRVTVRGDALYIRDQSKKLTRRRGVLHLGDILQTLMLLCIAAPQRKPGRREHNDDLPGYYLIHIILSSKRIKRGYHIEITGIDFTIT